MALLRGTRCHSHTWPPDPGQWWHGSPPLGLSTANTGRAQTVFLSYDSTRKSYHLSGQAILHITVNCNVYILCEKSKSKKINDAMILNWAFQEE